MKKLKTPELNKMAAIRDKSQVIGEFLDWLHNERGLTLATFIDDEDRGEVMVPFHFSTEKLLAEFFEIDLDRIEKERRLVLKACAAKCRTSK